MIMNADIHEFLNNMIHYATPIISLSLLKHVLHI